MSLKEFASTTFDRLHIGAGFADPNFCDRRMARGKPGGLGDFTICLSNHGLFVKIHPKFAYRSGRSGEEEAVISYESSAETLFSCQGAGNYTPLSDNLLAQLFRAIMNNDPGCTSEEQRVGNTCSYGWVT